MTDFDYEGALKAGYNDDEIINYLSEGNKDFDVKAAREANYTPREIAEYLSGQKEKSPSENQEKKPERTVLEKSGRLAGQVALGIAQGSAPGMVYDLAVAPLSSEGANTQLYRQNVFEDIERLAEQKQTGVWDQADQELLDHLVDQVKNPTKMDQYVKTGPDVSIRGLAEAATGLDLHPEGWAEKAANFIGFIKDPKSIKELKNIGLDTKELIKAISPTTKEALRGVGAGAALEMAEQGNFGPVGSIAAMIVGDLIGHGAHKIGKSILNPKQSAAEAINFLTLNNTQRLSSAQLAEDFGRAGMTIDAGTLTGSPIIQMIQARLAQSGLTGTALDNFRKELSNQVVKQYESILSDLGELAFENNHQAAEAIKSALKVEEQSLNINKESLKDQAARSPSLKGRISVEEPPNYQQTLLDEIAQPREQSTYSKGENLKQAAEDIKAGEKAVYDERFTDLNEQVREIPSSPQQTLDRELRMFVEENRGSLLLGESTAEFGVVQAAENLLNRLGEGQFGVTLNELIKTKRTLGDLANWEFHGSNFESAYKELVRYVDEAIVRGLSDYPEIRNEFLNLNADYSNFKNTFENETVKNLFKPKNRKYNSLYNEFSSDIDKIKALEEIAPLSPHGEEMLRRVKRDFAEKIISKPNLSSQDITDLRNVLGPEYDQQMLDFITARQQALESPRQITPQQSLGIQAQVVPTPPIKGLGQRKVSETGTESARQGLRKKLSEQLASKNSDQIMKQMNTIEGIRKLKTALETTKEGKELFRELSRYKLSELIDKKMTDAVTGEIQNKKFAGLLNDNASRAIVKELLGEAQFNKLQLLQKNAGALAESAGKFFNASKSGTTLADVGVIGTAMAGLVTLNPAMYVPAAAAIGGSYAIARLLADPVFLGHLQNAIKTNNPRKFMSFIEKMEPIVAKAIAKQMSENEEKSIIGNNPNK